MRISDWSSDVCSSDLPPVHEILPSLAQRYLQIPNTDCAYPDLRNAPIHMRIMRSDHIALRMLRRPLVGAASCKPACIFALCSNAYLVRTIIFLNSRRSEEHTSELQSLMRISYAGFCLKKKNTKIKTEDLSIVYVHEYDAVQEIKT